MAGALSLDTYGERSSRPDAWHRRDASVRSPGVSPVPAGGRLRVGPEGLGGLAHPELILGNARPVDVDAQGDQAAAVVVAKRHHGVRGAAGSDELHVRDVRAVLFS